MSKRALAIISTLAAAPVVALLSLAGTANAATPSPGYFSETTSLLGQGSYDSATFRTPAGAGDCVRTASSVTLSPISGSNNTQAVATWRSTANTGHTNNADIWHMRFEFLTSDGRIGASTPTLDGARMSRINTPYSWSQSVVVNMDPANYRILTAVRAYNSC
jgi:hypothetical protein